MHSLRFRFLAVATLATASFMACASDRTTAPIPLGCFSVSLGTFSPELPEPLPPMPASVRLTDRVGSDGLENGRLEVESHPAVSANYRWAWWEQRPGDSVHVVLTTGFTGVSLRLARVGHDYRGVASAFFDFTPSAPEATARLTSASCP